MDREASSSSSHGDASRNDAEESSDVPPPTYMMMNPTTKLNCMSKEHNAIFELSSRAKFEEGTNKSKEATLEHELHMKRLDWLRNKVKFIEETDWMYTPIEQILGFKDEKPVTTPTEHGIQKIGN